MTFELPSWMWAVPVVLLGVLRPRLVIAVVRSLVMLVGALLLAIFASVCL